MVKPIRHKGRIVGYAVVHGHPKKAGSKTDKKPGAIIKTFRGKNAKARAHAMHTAIIISQARAAGHRIPKK